MCQSCYYSATPERRAAAIAANRRYRQRNAGKIARQFRARKIAKFGLTPDEYRDMVVGQAGRCLICLRVPDHDLAIDHDHATGRVRGLLCKSCNLALGHLYDDARRADRAAGYLRATR